MNHDQQGSSQEKSTSTGGVPSLPSVLAPLAGYRYAKSVGDRETMLTEAMKFRGKMNDESIKQTEKYNKDVKKAEADRDEAVRNFEIAKGANKAEADVYKRGYTALQSHVNRLTTKLIDLGIDARVADGAGGKITQGVLAWEQETGKKFEDQPPEVQNRLMRLFTEDTLKESKAIIAEEAITSGRAKPGAKEVSHIAGGRPPTPPTPPAPTKLTSADSIVVDWLIKNENLTKEEALKYLDSRRSGSSSSSGSSGAGRNLTTGEMDKFAERNIMGQIVASIWSPERTDVPRWADAASGESPSSDEMWQLTEGLMNELGRTQTLPTDMLFRINGLESVARAELQQLQANYPDIPLFDESDNGRIIFHRNVTPEDKAKARRYMPIKTYFDSPEGQAFKDWLTKSASAGYYMHMARPAAASGGQPAQDNSGQHITPSGGAGGSGGQRPASTSPRRTTAPAPKPKPTGWRGVSKGAGNPDVMIPEGSEIENTITGKLGAGRKDWVQWQGDTYRVLEFWTTDNPKVPFMVKLRKYAKEYRRGKMRNKASYEWLYPKQLIGLQKINMPEDIRAMIENNQMP